MPSIFSISSEKVLNPKGLERLTPRRLPDCPWPIKNKVVLRSGIRYDEAFLLVDEPVGDAIKDDGYISHTLGIADWTSPGWYCVKRWKVFAGQTPIYYLRFVDRRGLELDSAVSLSVDIQGAIDGAATGEEMQDVFDDVFTHHFSGAAVELPPGSLNNVPTVVGIHDKTVGQLLQILADHIPAIMVRDPETNAYSFIELTTNWEEPEEKFLATHDNGLMPNATVNKVIVSDGSSEGETLTANANGFRRLAVYIDNKNADVNYQSFASAVDYMQNRAGKIRILPEYHKRTPNQVYDTITYCEQTTVLEAAVIPRCDYFPGGGSPGGINMAICQATQNVLNTDTTFSAKIIENKVGSASVGSVITAKNLDAGELTDPISGTTLFNAGVEHVFSLVDKMYFLAIKCDDGQWQAIQAGGVFEDYSIITGDGGGGPSPT